MICAWFSCCQLYTREFRFEFVFPFVLYHAMPQGTPDTTLNDE